VKADNICHVLIFVFDSTSTVETLLRSLFRKVMKVPKVVMPGSERLAL
jgi:hypothetical protein